LTIGFQAALTPLVVAHYKEAETPATMARIFRYFLVVALLGCVGVSIFAREILALFAAPEYSGAAALVPLLAPAVLLPTMYVFAPGLFLSKKTRAAASISILNAVLNTVLNFALIPLLGTRGSALATLLSAALCFAIFMSLSQRAYRVPHEWRTIAVALVGCVLTIAAAIAVPSLTTHLLLMLATVLWLPFLLLGGDEVRAILATARARS
jgi:O-antigen/teichoic acid export membrane protein